MQFFLRCPTVFGQIYDWVYCTLYSVQVRFFFDCLLCIHINNSKFHLDLMPLILRGSPDFSYFTTTVKPCLPGEYLSYPLQRPNPQKNMVYYMPGLTLISPYVHSRVDSSTFTIGHPMPESTLTLCQRQLSVQNFPYHLPNTL